MQRNVHELASGRWPGLLVRFGLSERELSGRHGPCPLCGGKDRFRFDDKDGRGTFFCSQCGAGSGLDLLMRLKGWDFRQAALEVERIVGAVLPSARPQPLTEAAKVAALRQTWAEASPLQAGDEAMRYFAGRGLALAGPPAELRLHPGLPYHDDGRFAGRFPALLARVIGADGTGLTLHRTYLQDGRKAPVSSPKKLMPGRPIAGGAVRLFPVAEHIGIAEGIETALAAAELFGLPIWSGISANGIETFEPPAGVRHITVFADDDPNFVGQKSAFTAAQRLHARGFAVDVRLPPAVGDWLDVLHRK